LALLVPGVTLGAPMVEGVSKWVVARARPASAAYGFPSGHALAAVVFFGALVYVTWATTRRPFWRGLSLVGGVAMVLGIGYTRLYLDAHWFTDVIGGLLAGTAYLLFVILAFERWGRHLRRSRVQTRTRCRPAREEPSSPTTHAIVTTILPLIAADRMRGRTGRRTLRPDFSPISP
jgi:membrane-associated phospholipid phosphatase